MTAPGSNEERDNDLLSHIDEAIRHADSLVGRAVSVIADPCSCVLDDVEDIARVAGQLRNALRASRCLVPKEAAE